MPTVVTWTGLDVPDGRGGNPLWSDPGNWKNNVVPQDFDDVVFPTGVATTFKFDHANNLEAPPELFQPFNSFNDLNITLNTLTIADRDFYLGGNPITLKSQLLASSTFSDGVSWIHCDLRLLGNPQSIDVESAGATLVLSGSLSDGNGTAGIIKQGRGTLVLANDLTDFADFFDEDDSVPDDPQSFESTSNSFTGLVEVAAGTLEILSPTSLGSTVHHLG
ncbi:MAG: hypothetical protein HYS12_05290 [Planctomycetes bacterium]|nr:hypothetical protein [Planctomycetota bacterium]